MITKEVLDVVLEALEDAVVECEESEDTSMALDRKLVRARNLLYGEMSHDEDA